MGKESVVLTTLLVIFGAAACEGVTPEEKSEAPGVTATGSVSESTGKRISSDEAAEDAPRQSVIVGSESYVARLFANMEATTGQERTLYEADERNFVSHPNAIKVLREVYASQPKTDYNGRWRTVYLAAQIHTPEAVAFLEEVALAPIVSASAKAPATDQSAHDDPGGDDFRARIRAAVGIVQSSAQGVTGADASVNKLLTQGDPAVAQVAAVELFGMDKLTPALAAILKGRGLPSAFRKLSDAERESITRMDPAVLTRHDGKAMTKPALAAK